MWSDKYDPEQAGSILEEPRERPPAAHRSRMRPAVGVSIALVGVVGVSLLIGVAVRAWRSISTP